MALPIKRGQVGLVRPGAGPNRPAISFPRVAVNPPSLGAPRERILLSGDSGSGKTYAYLVMARRLKVEAEAKGIEPPKFFVLDTDDAATSALSPNSSSAEFTDLLWETGGNVYPYPGRNFLESGKYLGALLAQAKPGDWIVVDVVTRLYEQAKTFYATHVKGASVGELFLDQTLKDNKAAFAAFEGGEWDRIGGYHTALVDPLVYETDANILLCAHVKDLVEQRAKREAMLIYDDIGLSPAGSATVATKLTGMMHTSIVMWANRVIPVDDSGRKRDKTRPTTVERHFSVVKDRGQTLGTTVDAEFGTDLFLELDAVRKHAKGDAIIGGRKPIRKRAPGQLPVELREAELPEAPAVPEEGLGTLRRRPGR